MSTRSDNQHPHATPSRDTAGPGPVKTAGSQEPGGSPRTSKTPGPGGSSRAAETPGPGESAQQQGDAPREDQLVIIGAGPGGYVAALRAAQLGISVTLIDRRPTLGGTCLNVGCIPSKALLNSSEHYHHTRHGLDSHGISVSGVTLDLPAMMARKDQVVEQLTRGVGGLVSAAGIRVIQGFARIARALPGGGAEVEIASGDAGGEDPQGDLPADLDPFAGNPGVTRITARQVILATGSEPAELPGMAFDGNLVLSSTHALALQSVPKRLGIVGGGIIGLEMASLWARLGSQVTVFELTDQILPGWEPRIAGQLKKQLEGLGIRFHLGTKARILKKNKKTIQVALEPREPAAGSLAGDASPARDNAGAGRTGNTGQPGKGEQSLTLDRLLVSVGRRPRTRGLGLEALGVQPGRGGFLPVNDRWQVLSGNEPLEGIYAIGDLVPGPMLAHKAEEEGAALAEILAGQAGHVNYQVIPGVVYTWPEAAMTGLTEAQLKEQDIPYRKGSFSFLANGRALAMGHTAGQVIIYAHEKTDRILGAHILGPGASDLIAEIVVLMEMGGSSEDLARIVHAHPTLSEAVKEAALSVDGRSIHSTNPKRKR